MQGFGPSGHLFPDHGGQVHPGQRISKNNSQGQAFGQFFCIDFKSRLGIDFLIGYGDDRDITQIGGGKSFFDERYVRGCPTLTAGLNQNNRSVFRIVPA